MRPKPKPKTCYSRSCVCYNIFTGKRSEFKSITALSAYIDKNVTNTGKIMRSGMHIGDWIVAYIEDEKKAIEKLRVFQGHTTIKPKANGGKRVSLRIDAKTVIMVAPENATPEYAAKWKARHEQDERHTYAKEFINANDSIKLPKRRGGRQ